MPLPASEIQRVFLDLGHVLFKLSYAETVELIASKSVATAAEIERFFHYNDTHIAYETGKLASHDFFSQVMNAIGFREDLATFERIWLDFVTPLEDNFAFARELADQYPVGIISNIGSAHVEAIEHATILTQFTDLRIYSCQVGYMKPGSEIYLEALKQANTPPEHCVFIDDRPENIESAQALGIHAYLFPKDSCLRQFWSGLLLG